MILANLGYLPIILLALTLFAFLALRVEQNYFQWVKDHWFLNRSLASKLGSALYLIGFSLLLLALLDPRGAERLVRGEIGDQKTIILIDMSASMLAEDVRPNRFERALLLAKHFIKKAAGHQISIIAFSDGQKRIVPFTGDTDLVEARLDTLAQTDLKRGGTGLSLALRESARYFIDSGERPVGNILVFTDAEETDEGVSIEVPDGISVAVIGIGTAKGAPIPMRDSRGSFKGNKRYKGEIVISKLDEDFLAKMGSEVKRFRHWVASSYTLPTEEVLAFFDRSFKTRISNSEFRIRPTLHNYFLAPAAILLAMAFLLKNFRSFAVVAILLAWLPGNAPAQEQEPPEKTPLILELEEKFSQNQLSAEGKEKLASELLKAGFAERSETLYEELVGESGLDEASSTALFNMGAAKFKAGDTAGGMNVYAELMERLEANPSSENNELLEKARMNALKAIAEEAKERKNKEENSKQSEDQEGESGENEQDESNPGQSESGQDKARDEGESQPGDKEKEQGGKDERSDSEPQNGDDENREKKEKESSAKSDSADKEKMPSILKQLLSDDNQLQKKVIDAQTVEPHTKEKKDW